MGIGGKENRQNLKYGILTNNTHTVYVHAVVESVGQSVGRRGESQTL
jgi:hypothetical protein